MLLDGKVAIVSGVGPGLGQANARALAREGATVVLAARNADYLAAGAEGDRGGRRPGARGADQPRRCRAGRGARRAHRRRVRPARRARQQRVPHGHVPAVRRRRPHEVAQDLRGQRVGRARAHAGVRPAPATRRGRQRRRVDRVHHLDEHAQDPRSEGGYSSSKAAVQTAAKTMAVELGPGGVRVNCVAPGWIGGPNVETFIEGVASSAASPDDVRAEIEARIPLGLIPPQDDIANSVVFFASPWSTSSPVRRSTSTAVSGSPDAAGVTRPAVLPARRVPAETDPHERTLMAWPTEARRASLWGDQLDAARAVHVLVARAIAAYEPVTMVADPERRDGGRGRLRTRRRGGRGADRRLVDSRLGPDHRRRRRRHAAHAVHFRFNALGREVHAVRPATRRSARASPRTSGCRSPRCRSCSKAARSRSTARARS